MESTFREDVFALLQSFGASHMAKSFSDRYMPSVKLLSQMIRYIGAGAINTGVTLLLCQVLLFVLPYKAAYTLSFGTGIVLAAVLYSRAVFATKLSWRGLLRFTFAYLTIYTLGLYSTVGQVELLNVPVRIAPITTTILLLPIGFLASRYALSGSRAQAGE